MAVTKNEAEQRHRHYYEGLALSGEVPELDKPQLYHAQRIRVWKVNDYEWWAGVSLEEIKAEAIKQGYKPDDLDEGFDNPQEVSSSDMVRLHFRIELEIDGDDIPDSETFWSFKNELEAMIARNQVFPCCFACTEY